MSKDKHTVVAHESVSTLQVDKFESVDSDGVLSKLRGKFSTSAEASRNGRTYTPELWRQIVNMPIVKELIDAKMFLGELSHPPVETEYLTEVQIGNASHNITKLEYIEDTGEVYGELDILDTPSGRIANTLIKYGSQLGISSRGAMMDDGSPRMDESRMTPSNYYFITFDLVALPGIKGARLDPIFESLSLDSQAESRTELHDAVTKAIESGDEEALRVLENLVTHDKKLLSRVTEALHDKSFSDNQSNSEDSEEKDKESRTNKFSTGTSEQDDQSDEPESQESPVDNEVEDDTESDPEMMTDKEVDEELEDTLEESSEVTGTQVADVGLAMVDGKELLTPINDELKIVNESSDEEIQSRLDSLLDDDDENVIDPSGTLLSTNKDGDTLVDSIEDIDEYLGTLGFTKVSDKLLDDEDIHLSDKDEDPALESLSRAISRIERQYDEKIKVLESSNLRLTRLVESTQTKYDQSVKESKSIKSDMLKTQSQLESAVNESKTEILQLRDDNRKLRMMRKSSINEASSSKAHLSRLKGINESLTTDLNKSNRKVVELSKEVAKLRRELDVKSGRVLESKRQARNRNLLEQLGSGKVNVKSINESLTPTEDPKLSYRTEVTTQQQSGDIDEGRIQEMVRNRLNKK